jgi:cytochrome c oxidase cbb3-type subunit 3
MGTSGSAPDHDPKIVHVYDDIEEEDNRLPNWWLFILFATIVFAFGYWFVYHTAKLRPLPRESYAAAVEQIVAARIAANPASDEAILALSRDPEALAKGAEVYRTTCAACHGASGEGVIGPNLTDRAWIHEHSPAEILRGVREGYTSKGMPAWEPIIGAERCLQAAAYVLTLRGQNLAGKAPQGELVD